MKQGRTARLAAVTAALVTTVATTANQPAHASPDTAESVSGSTAATAHADRRPIPPPDHPRKRLAPPNERFGRASASPRSGSGTVLADSATAVTLMAAAPSVPKGTGPGRNATLISFNLADRLQAEVNVGSGNLLVRSTDLVLPGLGDDVTLGAAYNSLLVGSGVATGALGTGWRTRTGVDVKLIAADDGTVTYVAADGVVGVFTPSGATGYTGPGEFKATLTKTSAGWTLREHESGRLFTFTSEGLLDKWSDRNNNVTDFSYDSAGRQTEIVSTRGGANAKKATVTYASTGRLATYKQTGNDGVTTRTVTYSYSGGSTVTGITAASGRPVEFEYDASGNLTLIRVGGPDGLCQENRMTYDSAHRITSFTHVTDLSTGSGATTRFAYPSTTQTLVADANTDLSKAVTAVPRTTYTVNAEKRVTAVQDPAGNTRSTSYTPFHDVASATTAESGVTTNTYGANGGQSLTRSASPTGSAVQIAYANPATTGNPTANFQPSSSSDRQGNTSIYTYSGAGNLASSKNATAAEAKLTHNSDGTIATSTDPGNGTNATRYSYDTTTKQLTTLTPPTGNSLGVRQFTYDTLGRMRTATDGAGRTMTYSYDNDDRVVTVDYSDGTPSVTYQYDDAGNLTQRDDRTGTVWFAYDPLNRLTQRAPETIGGNLDYTYDAVGNLKTVVDGRGTTTYSYDTRNLLTAMVTDNGTRYEFAYDKDGRRTTTWFGANVGHTTWKAQTTTSYDKSGRISRVRTQRDSAAPATVSDVTTCYATGTICASTTSDRGNVQWEVNNATGVRSDYSYDGGSRLTRATNRPGGNYDFTYDANGNRTSVKTNGSVTQSLIFNSANQITSTGRAYDGAGNQTTGATSAGTLAYNAAAQMTRVGTQPYDYAGTTQDETLALESADIIYGRTDQFGLPWIQAYIQYYSDGDTTTGYIDRDGRGTPLGVTIDGLDHFYVTDRLGSVTALVGTDTAVAASYSYDPYGVLKTSSGTRAEDNPLRFTGAYLDNFWGLGTGFTKLGTRWNNTAEGRFTQQDPISHLANPAEGNRYAYAADNPCNNLDPTGRDLCDWIGLGASFAGAGLMIAGLIVTGPVAGAAILAAGIFVEEFGLAMAIAGVSGNC